MNNILLAKIHNGEKDKKKEPEKNIPKNILLAKIRNDEKQKNKEHEHNMPESTPYKHKVRKIEFSSHGDETSNDESMKNHTKKQQDSS